MKINYLCLHSYCKLFNWMAKILFILFVQCWLLHACLTDLRANLHVYMKIKCNHMCFVVHTIKYMKIRFHGNYKSKPFWRSTKFYNLKNSLPYGIHAWTYLATFWSSLTKSLPISMQSANYMYIVYHMTLILFLAHDKLHGTRYMHII